MGGMGDWTKSEWDEFYSEMENDLDREIEKQRLQDKIFGADFPTAIKMFAKPNKEAIDIALKIWEKRNSPTVKTS